MDTTKANQLLNRAKTSIIPMTNTDFIGSILFSLNQEFDNSISTACVDGITIKMNPTFVESLSVDEMVFLLLHESWHVAFEHIMRAQEVDDVNFKIFNDAADYVINHMLISLGFKMPAGANAGLYDTKFADYTTEQVYEYLLDQQKKNPNKSKPKNGLGNDIAKEPPTDGNGKPMSKEQVQAKIEDIILAATSVAKDAGTYGSVPGEIQRHYDALVDPKVDWRTQLMDIATSISDHDYSMQVPDRTYTHLGVYVPSLYSESAGNITFVMDLSGSVTKEDLTKGMSEMQGVRDVLDPEIMTVLGFDHIIQDTTVLQQGDTIDQVSLTGGGGTNIHPVIEWGIENQPEVMVIMTDGYFFPFEKKIDFPIIWLIVGNKDFTAVNGTVVHYEE